MVSINGRGIVVFFSFLFLSGLCWRTLQVSLQINFLIEGVLR